MQPKHKIFETKRLILHPVSVEDSEFLFQLMNSPKWLQFVGDKRIRSVRGARRLILWKMIPQFQRMGFGNYIIQRKTDLTKIGTCGLFRHEGLDGIDICYGLLEKYEGHGYAYESVSCLIEVATGELAIKNLYAITTRENFSSQRLLNKIGLKFKKFIPIPENDADLFLYKYISDSSL